MTPADGGTTTTAVVTLREWLGGAQPRLAELTGAAERLRDLSPDSDSNQGILLGLADSAQATAVGLRALPRPSTGQAESDALTGSIEALADVARSASSCVSDCRATYSTVVTAQGAVADALRRVFTLAQAGG